MLDIGTERKYAKDYDPAVYIWDTWTPTNFKDLYNLDLRAAPEFIIRFEFNRSYRSA